MPKIKIDCKPLIGIKKTVDIKPTVALENKVQDIKIEMLEHDNADETTLEGMKFIRKANDDFVDFVCIALQLTDKQRTSIENSLTGKEMSKVCFTLLMKIQGSSDKQINELWKQGMDSLKKEQVIDPKDSKPKENKK